MPSSFGAAQEFDGEAKIRTGLTLGPGCSVVSSILLLQHRRNDNILPLHANKQLYTTKSTDSVIVLFVVLFAHRRLSPRTSKDKSVLIESELAKKRERKVLEKVQRRLLCLQQIQRPHSSVCDEHAHQFQVRVSGAVKTVPPTHNVMKEKKRKKNFLYAHSQGLESTSILAD